MNSTEATKAKITIPTRIIDEMKAQAREDSPNECCGLLGGRDGQVNKRLPLRNHSSTPERSYFASPEDLFRCMRQIRNDGDSLLAIYHSHPSGPSHPSATDVATAYYPHVLYLIISLVPEAQIRAFAIRNAVVEEAHIIELDNEVAEPDEMKA